MHVEDWTLAGQVVLLSDTLRVDAYRRAIRETVRPGDVVVELGSGTGVLARIAALSGASRVIAVDDSPELCELNQHINQLLGLDRRIEVVQARVEQVTLREKVDVVVSELIGDLVDDEGMSRVLTAFCAANGDRLAPDVRLVPERVSLFGQLVPGAEVAGMMRGEDEDLAVAMARALAGELRVLTHLDGVRTVGEPFCLLRVGGAGERHGGCGESVTGFDPSGLRALPRAMVCWFEARLTEGVSIDSRGDGRVRTSWGLPLVPVLHDPSLVAGSPEAAELRFSLDRDSRGELAVEARLVGPERSSAGP